MYVYIRLGHFAVGQKLTEHCKSTKKKKKEKETRNKSDAIIKKKNLKDFKVKRIQNDSQIGIALQCPGFFLLLLLKIELIGSFLVALHCHCYGSDYRFDL